jgi:hypothetical protein
VPNSHLCYWSPFRQAKVGGKYAKNGVSKDASDLKLGWILRKLLLSKCDMKKSAMEVSKTMAYWHGQR